jgi:hypothetical protein
MYVLMLVDRLAKGDIIVPRRWVNIGKERDGMKPDAVQYARALRPPYHLLSFLRIKGKSTKGKSCTDKNTMVRKIPCVTMIILDVKSIYDITS